MKKTVALLPLRLLSSLLFALLTFFSISASAQNDHSNRIAKKVADLKLKGVFTKNISIFSAGLQTAPDKEILAVVKKYTPLNLFDTKNIQQKKPLYLSFSIPADNGNKQLKLTLYKEDISPNGFTLKTDKDENVLLQQDIVHYRGSIDGDPNSVAAFTFSNNEVTGIINNNDGNYVIGKTRNATGNHIIYNDKDILTKAPFDCATNTFLPLSPVTAAKPATATASTTKCVNWYWETDYDMFVNKGSIENVNAYMQAVFNQMATLYANDGMTMTLKTLFVWTTEDPYTGTSTSGYLNQFGAYRTTFDGDLAHLIGLKGSGGIAWIKGLCKTTKYRMAYSGISATYKAVPSYSWSVECITHEQGHLLGSPHTHDCAWNGNNTKIDGCGDAAGYSSGSCAVPSTLPSGGTIMSYCHLTSAGINFNLGFGPQPTELMINTINAATCLTTCTTSCAVPSQPNTITGSAALCTSGTAVTYSVAAVSGATSYTWTLPSGWSGTSTTNTINATTGTAGGTISVKANNSCGSSTAQTLAVTVSSTPAQPGSITGNTSMCPASSQTYSIAATNGASSYKWVLPSGWTGSSTTNSITVTAGTAGGTISVNAVNSCGTSAARTLPVTITTSGSVPATPGIINGSATVCPNTIRSYYINTVSGATSYLWTIPAGSVMIDSTPGFIRFRFGSSAGNITVKAVNACGASGASIKKIGFYTTCAAATVNTNTAIGKDIGTKTSTSTNSAGTINMEAVTSIRVLVFPNPARDKINVQFNSVSNTTYMLSITDMVGRTILQQNKLAAPGLNIHSFNVNGFSKGTYIIKIQSKDEKQLLKVNVE